MSQPTLNVKAGDVLIIHGRFSYGHAIVRVETLGKHLHTRSTLRHTGEWDVPARGSLPRPRANLGPLSPKVDLELLYKAVERIDSDYRHAVAAAEQARQRDFDHLARGFTGDLT